MAPRTDRVNGCPRGRLRISMVTHGGDIGGGDVLCSEDMLRKEEAVSYTASHLLGEGMCGSVRQPENAPSSKEES